MKETSTETFKMVYDGYDCVADYADDDYDTLLRYYVTPILDENLMVYDDAGDDEEYFYIHDGLGTVRQIVDASQNVENTYDYEGFGTGVSQTENIYNRFRYTGREYDAETEATANDGTGLYYYRARTYDSTIGSFTSRDPISSLNLYPYCHANPIIFTDPSGKEIEDCCLEITSREIYELMLEAFNEIYDKVYNSTDNQRLRNVLDKVHELLTDEESANIELGAYTWVRYDTIEGLGRVKVHKFDYNRRADFHPTRNNGKPSIRINLAPLYKDCLCNKNLSDEEKKKCAKTWLATRLIHESGHWLEWENRNGKKQTEDEINNEEGRVRFDTAMILYEAFGEDIFDEDTVVGNAAGVWFAEMNQSAFGSDRDIDSMRTDFGNKFEERERKIREAGDSGYGVPNPPPPVVTKTKSGETTTSDYEELEWGAPFIDNREYNRSKCNK